MTKKMIAYYSTIALFVVLSFQNCANPNFQSSRYNGSARYSGGQPYDGKPYIRDGTCADGGVESRILYHNSNSASLVRENCAAVTPARALSGQDFSLDATNADLLRYGALDFHAELAIAPGTSFRPSLVQKPAPSDSGSVFMVDVFALTADEVKALKLGGHAVLCAISIGTRESWRSDAAAFPTAALGNTSNTNERFVDIRSNAVRDLMVARLGMARDKVCDGVTLDHGDSFENNSGFPLTSADQISYNQFLLGAARGMGLLTGVQSGVTIAASMVAHADVAIVEQCYQFNECAAYQPYADAGKAVFILEYQAYSAARCTSAASSGFSLVFTDTNYSSIQACP